MRRFNYIITIHNKEDMIESVLTAIFICAGQNSHVYPVLDGCTDRTEAVIDRLTETFEGLPITKLYAPDVHEILSINTALRQVPQEGEGYNILLQDDVILSDRDFETKVQAVYKHFDDKIGMLSFRHGINLDIDDVNREIVELDLIESCYGHGHTERPLLPGMASVRMVSVRSPECISFRTVREIGLMDEKYAPFTYDNHDYSLRCLKAGLCNVIFPIKIQSKVEWGGMRKNPQPNTKSIMKRNRQYMYNDHGEFIRGLNRNTFCDAPLKVADHLPHEDETTALLRYEENRRRLKEFRSKGRFGRELRSIVKRVFA